MKLSKDPVWMVAVGSRLEILCRVRDLNQAELARVLDITPQRLNNYMRGARPFPIDLALALCSKYECTLDYLYRGAMGGLPFWMNQRVLELEGKVARPPGGDDGLKN
jgi:transcriptional regulator with XRE-family HTH domain